MLWLVALALPAGGYIADRTGLSSTILIGGLIAFPAALLIASRVDWVVPAFILLGVVSGLPCGPIMGLPARVLAPETRGVGMGLFFTVYYALQVACPWFVGEIAKIAGSAQMALDLGAVFLCVGGAVWMIFRRLARDFMPVGKGDQMKLAMSSLPRAKAPVTSKT